MNNNLIKKCGLTELSSKDMRHINGGNIFWYVVGYIAGTIVSAAEYEGDVQHDGGVAYDSTPTHYY